MLLCSHDLFARQGYGLYLLSLVLIVPQYTDTQSLARDTL